MALSSSATAPSSSSRSSRSMRIAPLIARTATATTLTADQDWRRRVRSPRQPDSASAACPAAVDPQASMSCVRSAAPSWGPGPEGLMSASETDEGIESAELVAGERPQLPRPERAQRNWADVCADQPLDGMADRREHPAHDVIAPLVDDEFDENAAARTAHHLERVDMRGPVLQRDARPQRATEVLGDRPAHLGDICLRDLVSGVGKAVRQLAIVREQDQSLGVGIEPADVKQPVAAVADVIP